MRQPAGTATAAWGGAQPTGGTAAVAGGGGQRTSTGVVTAVTVTVASSGNAVTGLLPACYRPVTGSEVVTGNMLITTIGCTYPYVT